MIRVQRSRPVGSPPPARSKRRVGDAPRRSAAVFAALGDETRLTLLTKLSGGTPLSISRLTRGGPITRQAVTKHLRVLRHAGLVRSVRRGRENCFEIETAALRSAQERLAMISRQWDEALGRLKASLERPNSSARQTQ